jgi:glucose-6-phosphate 1-dehydrogenase
MPSLFSLFKQKLLPDNFSIIGFSRREMSDEDFKRHFVKHSDAEDWEAFAAHLTYQKGLFEEQQGYLELIDKLQEFDRGIGECAIRMFYLATPPANYEAILGYLDKTELSQGCGG